ncbi:MAG TPA: enoyl-CoA hydratase-related protein, partial [Ilumatobacteraceae bacterium]|nr:enoyl-CoA hydratase-related protein [Ilumatobacteraceae bacterium]
VVVVRGSCIGIATYLAVLADFTVAATDASFGLPEERFGSAGATWIYPFLIREIGIKRATEMVMTGRRYSGDEMARLGLVTRAVDAAALDDSAAQLTNALCSLPREGIAINRAVKRLSLDVIGHTSSFGFHAALHPLAERMQREDDEFNFMAHAAEHGMKAAIEERNRRFAGDWWGW